MKQQVGRRCFTEEAEKQERKIKNQLRWEKRTEERTDGSSGRTGATGKKSSPDITCISVNMRGSGDELFDGS